MGVNKYQNNEKACLMYIFILINLLIYKNHSPSPGLKNIHPCSVGTIFMNIFDNDHLKTI